MNIYDEITKPFYVQFDQFIAGNTTIILKNLFNPEEDFHAGKYITYEGYLNESETISVPYDKLCNIQLGLAIFTKQLSRYQKELQHLQKSDVVNALLEITRNDRYTLKINSLTIISENEVKEILNKEKDIKEVKKLRIEVKEII